MSDLQSRLKFIEQQADRIADREPGAGGNDEAFTDRRVRETSKLVAYLAAIILKHLETGET